MKHSRIFSQFLIFLAFTFATLAIIFAIIINVGRAYIPQLDTQKSYFETWLSQAFGVPVKIGHISGEWQWFDPLLKFDEVVVKDKTGQYSVIHVKEIQVGIDLFYSLFKAQLLPGHLAVIGTRLTAYEQNGQVQLQGIESNEKNESTDLGSLLGWLVTQADVVLDQVQITWHDPSGVIIPIQNLRLRIKNESDHKLRAIIQLGQTVPSEIKVTGHFTDIDLKQLAFNGEAYVELNDVLLSQWSQLQLLQPYLKQVSVHSGELNAQLWAYWHDDALSKVQTQFDIEQAGFKLPSTDKIILASHLAGNAVWMHEKQGWKAIVDQWTTRINGISWPKNAYQLTYEAGKEPQLQFGIAYMPINLLVDIASGFVPLPDNYKALYSTLSPQAKLYHLTFSKSLLEGDSNPYTLSTDFADLQMKTTSTLPALNHVNGHLTVQATQGDLWLVGEQCGVSIPKAFSHPLLFDLLQGHVHWTKAQNAWHVQADHLHAFDQDVNLMASMQLLLADNAAPDIDLLMGATVNDAKKVPQYLPDHVLKPKVLHWLDRAFVSGSVKSATMVLRGPATQFPFNQQHNGRFQVVFDANDLTLHYHDHWPDFTNIRANVDFDDSSLFITAPQALSVGNTLKNISAAIPNLHLATLNVSGESNTDLNHAQTFIEKTPLSIGGTLSVLKLAGPGALHLNLSLPVDDDVKKPFTLQGDLIASNALLSLPAWHVQLQNLTGPIHFTENTLSADKITANLLNTPVLITMNTYHPGLKDSFFNVNLSGQMDVVDLQKKLKLSPTPLVKGSTHYELALKIPSDNHQPLNVTLLSDLRGIQCDLPAPLRKTADEVDASHISFDFKNNKPMNVFIHYGEKASVAFTLENHQGAMQLTSGEVHLGKGEAYPQTEPGLLVSGQFDQFNWQTWAPYLSTVGNSSTDSAIKIRLIHLFFNQINYNQMTLDKVDLRLQLSDFGYNVDIDSPNIAGNIRIPKNLNQLPITANLQKLYWPKSDKKTGVKNTLEPQSIPSLNIHVDNARWGNMDFGLMNIVTQKTVSGMNIEKLLLGNKEYTLELHGDWSSEHGVQNTRVTGSLGSSNFGHVLSNWHLTSMLAETHGEIDYKLYWNASLLNFDPKKLGGSVNINVRSGRILELGKQAESELGLGKLLSLLSLQELPRRLMLNFSDVTKKGFSFDVMKGDLVLTEGNAKTNNTYLDGPIAKVILNGEIGFGTKQLALTLDVRPYITSSLPLVATVAGGPVVGAVAWLANKIIAPSVGKAMRVVMRVSGPWSNPEIEKLSEVEGRRPAYHQ